MSIWFLPLLIVGAAIALAIPLGLYLAWILDGRYRPPRWLRWVEQRVDTGPQNGKQYTLALLFFNVVIFVFGFAVLALQPLLPLNPDGKTMLCPSTIFHTVCSFLSNTNQQHYSGEVHLSYFSQLFAICWNQFVTPAVGLSALAAIVRGLRGDRDMGNFYIDLWRSAIYILLPLAFFLGVLLMAGGIPMTFEGAAQAAIVEPGADGQPTVFQTLSRGPVAAVVAIKQLATNGGGFFAANSCHPFENPTAWTNFLECLSIVLLPMACLVMFGRMLRDFRQAAVIFAVMLLLSTATIVWAVYFDTMQPNPALAALPVDPSLGNLEGKELRFGTSAGTTWAALTTNTSNGSVNAMHDSLNPLAGLAPLAGMWLNCIWGGVGVGLINFLIYLIVGVFLAGLMVGRTPEYLGKKVEAREMKLAMLALLIHPLMVLLPTGLFAALDWGTKTTTNPGPHGFSEILYEFSSASANNGSGFEGLADTYGLNDNKDRPTYAIYWDIACGLVLVISRFIPIIAPIAIAGSLAAKKPTPFTAGTMRTDTVTFGFVLLGTILLVGALLFMPAAVLGPIAEHLGPIPFGQ
ncbi:MAG: potassium-transporting ATPase subunit KdpA [Gemmataceae bacterium]